MEKGLAMSLVLLFFLHAWECGRLLVGLYSAPKLSFFSFCGKAHYMCNFEHSFFLHPKFKSMMGK
jgi:hypothetical protein